MWAGLICCAWLLATYALWAAWSAVVKYRSSPAYLAWKQEEERKRKEAAMQADKEAARRHLARFYNQHKHLLAPVPPALLHAFLHSAMPDSLDPTQLWTIAHNKIAELQTLIEKERQAQEEGQLESQIAKLRAQHERRVGALRALADALDPESREAIELEQLIEEARTRLKTDLQKVNRT